MNILPDNLVEQIFKNTHELNYCSVMEEMVDNRMKAIYDLIMPIMRNSIHPPNLQHEAVVMYNLIQAYEFDEQPYSSNPYKARLTKIQECPLFDIYDIDEWHENEWERLEELHYNPQDGDDDSEPESEPERTPEPQDYRGRLRTSRNSESDSDSSDPDPETGMSREEWREYQRGEREAQNAELGISAEEGERRAQQMKEHIRAIRARAFPWL
jgi:hypothetical protein